MIFWHHIDDLLWSFGKIRKKGKKKGQNRLVLQKEVLLLWCGAKSLTWCQTFLQNASLVLWGCGWYASPTPLHLLTGHCFAMLTKEMFLWCVLPPFSYIAKRCMGSKQLTNPLLRIKPETNPDKPETNSDKPETNQRFDAEQRVCFRFDAEQRIC